MLIMKILFALLIIVCAVFYILYIWDFSLILLIVICSVPVLMFTSLLITKKMLSVDYAVKSRTAAKQEPFDVQLCVSNRSIFPVGKAEAIVEYFNIFNNQVNYIELHFPIQARNEQRLTFKLSSRFCGKIRIRSAYVTIYDPLRLFKFKVGKNIGADIVILPEGHDINGIVVSNDRFNDESSIFSEYKPGDDPSEVFDLREYNAGDKLSCIHWKLTSKRDEFIVKDYSQPVDSPAAIFLNLRCTEESEYTLPIFDTLIEAFVSLSQLYIENEHQHTLIYFNPREKQFVQRLINGIDSLASAVNELILTFSEEFYAESPEPFFVNNNYGWASFTFITADEDNRLLEHIDNELDADIKNVLKIVKSAEAADETDEIYSSVNIIPVVIGRISSSVRDIEL